MLRHAGLVTRQRFPDQGLWRISEKKRTTIETIDLPDHNVLICSWSQKIYFHTKYNDIMQNNSTIVWGKGLGKWTEQNTKNRRNACPIQTLDGKNGDRHYSLRPFDYENYWKWSEIQRMTSSFTLDLGKRYPEKFSATFSSERCDAKIFYFYLYLKI